MAWHTTGDPPQARSLPLGHNGPGYISGALSAWAQQRSIQINHIQPGKPQQNAYVERYNGTVCYAWLARTLFDSIKQVQSMATRWLWTYSHERPSIAPMQKLAMLPSSTFDAR